MVTCMPRFADEHPAAQRGDVTCLRDRKSTRLNSSHANISYAVFCLKKKKNTIYYKLNKIKNKPANNLSNLHLLSDHHQHFSIVVLCNLRNILSHHFRILSECFTYHY